jgi:uncharacterized protein YyaL (SSP411 family)
MLARLRGTGRLDVQVVWKEQDSAELDRLAPRQQGQSAINGRSSAHLCNARRCLQPVTSADELESQLAALQGETA